MISPITFIKKRMFIIHIFRCTFGKNTLKQHREGKTVHDRGWIGCSMCWQKEKNGCRMHTTKFFYKNIVVSLSPC